jgi:hypothetical protein
VRPHTATSAVVCANASAQPHTGAKPVRGQRLRSDGWCARTAVGVPTGRMVLLRSLPHALAAMQCVSRRGGICGCSWYFLRCRRGPRCRNVSVGDGVLDVPTLGSPPILRQTTCPYGVGTVGYRCHRTRFARPRRAGAVVVVGFQAVCAVGDAALSVPCVYCSGVGVFHTQMLWSRCSLRLLFGCGGSSTATPWFRGRDAEGGVPYMVLP